MFGIFKQATTIDCPEARELVHEHGAQLVDVRTPQEHAQGTLPGSVNIPLQVIHTAHNHLDKNKPIIVYCRSGARSTHAQKLLRTMGFDAVHNLGSINQYLTC